MQLRPTYEKFTIFGLVNTFTEILPALVPELLCLEPKASSSASRCICEYTTITLVNKQVYFQICVRSDLDVWGWVLLLMVCYTSSTIFLSETI